MKLVPRKLFLVSLLIFLWHSINVIWCSVDLNDDKTELANRLFNYYSADEGVNPERRSRTFCAMQQNIKKKVCAEIGEAVLERHVRTVTSKQGLSLRNYIYQPIGSIPDNYFKCEPIKFKYRFIRNGKIYFDTPEEQVFPCPPYTVESTFGGQTYRLDESRFMVSLGDQDHTAFVFKKPDENAVYLEPEYIVSNLLKS